MGFILFKRLPATQKAIGKKKSLDVGFNFKFFGFAEKSTNRGAASIYIPSGQIVSAWRLALKELVPALK